MTGETDVEPLLPFDLSLRSEPLHIHPRPNSPYSCDQFSWASKLMFSWINPVLEKVRLVSLVINPITGIWVGKRFDVCVFVMHRGLQVNSWPVCTSRYGCFTTDTSSIAMVAFINEASYTSMWSVCFGDCACAAKLPNLSTNPALAITPSTVQFQAEARQRLKSTCGWADVMLQKKTSRWGSCKYTILRLCTNGRKKTQVKNWKCCDWPVRCNDRLLPPRCSKSYFDPGKSPHTSMKIVNKWLIL